MEINILNQIWDVKVVSPHDTSLCVDGSYCRGACWCDRLTIAISNELNEKTLRRVIAHELTHALLWSSQVQIPEQFTEEQVCDFMAIYGAFIATFTEDVYTTVSKEMVQNEDSTCI